jgi:hypothetical protein
LSSIGCMHIKLTQPNKSLLTEWKIKMSDNTQVSIDKLEYCTSLELAGGNIKKIMEMIEGKNPYLNILEEFQVVIDKLLFLKNEYAQKHLDVILVLTKNQAPNKSRDALIKEFKEVINFL